ncbi:hypothetical protein [Desulfoscipio geothermicus]|uniref:hypothetical protein n=1 Tax=Desulfoscipio geothermicus TaxID=39060 RepID=UPI001041E3F8|nr:hypothetical protein [Desulfoscipio geothermicus]
MPFAKSGILPLIYENGRVLKEEHDPEGVEITTELGVVWAHLSYVEPMNVTEKLLTTVGCYTSATILPVSVKS